MTVRSITRRTFATGIAVAAGAAVMRNLINAQDSPAATPTAGATPQLLARVETIGSMQPELTFTAVPEFSLFDDGSIYALGPQLAIFPPPALPNLTVTKITPEATQALVAAARTAGLNEPRGLTAGVSLADAPTTYITFFDGKQEIVSSAPGLMILSERPDDWKESDWEEFLELRSIVSLMIGYAGTVDSTAIASPERSVDPERLQVVVYRSSNSFASASGIPNLEQPALVWPIAMPLTVMAGPGENEDGVSKSACNEFTGADLAAIVEVARQGDLHSPWVDAGTAGEDARYGVLMKPLLPDQASCHA